VFGGLGGVATDTILNDVLLIKGNAFFPFTTTGDAPTGKIGGSCVITSDNVVYLYG
jgi:hypothetical protein